MPTATRTAPRTATRTPLRLLLLLLAVLLLTGGFASAPAHAADEDVTWTVRTAPNSYGADRSSYSYGVNPGGHVEDAMVVANRGKKPLTLTVYAADGFTTDTGSLDLLPAGKKSVGVGAWLRTDATKITVRPGKTAEIPFTVAVPRKATPGDYVGGLLTSLKQSDDAEGINVDRRLGIKVKLRVSGALKPALAVEDAHVSYDGTADPFTKGSATLTYTVHNTGNAAVSARQAAELTGPFGWFTAHVAPPKDTPELLPGERWKVTVPATGVAPSFALTAKITLTPLLTDASGSTSPLSPVEATAHGTAIPWTLLVLVLALLACAVAALRLRSRRKQGEEERVREAVARELREREAKVG
ncbi:WxL protein peptidoglycan domain-containing protein [Streptomyces sp. NPDC058426]|uniref:WxL protein peptidoglycan domain-containing protein n=1 Tax=Streptomyces sp. NPDC058426 TaxID=3346493 RepID=UPI0036527F82